MSPGNGLGELACGRDRDRLLGLVADRTPVEDGAHEASCPYCQAALDELEALWRPVQGWAGRDLPPPADLVRTVMARVRQLVQSPHHVVATASRGATTVTSWVLSVMAGAAVEQVTGVTRVTGSGRRRRGAGRAELLRASADAVEVSEIGAAAIGIDLGIETLPVDDLAGLADSVRRQVIAEIQAYASLEVAEVNVGVDDVNLPSDP